MKILITGFEPFNNSAINPSQQILERLKAPDGVEVIKALLPVEFCRSALMIKELLKEHRPDAVLSLGQAGNRPEICVERVAINLDNVRSSDGTRELADNAGEKPVDRPIITGAPAAFFSTLPVWDIVSSIRQRDIPAAVSYTAGSYVCNHVMYLALHEASCNYPDMLAGFIHVPFLPEQVEGRTGGYAMHLADMITGVEAALAVINSVY